MDDAESIEQKLEQNEKIIQICAESLPHFSNNGKSSSSKLFVNKNDNGTNPEFSSGNKNKNNNANNSLNSSPENIVRFYNYEN